MRRILSILLENEPGALSRIVGLFSQRGYNIDSLTVAHTDDETLSRITISTRGDQRVLEQITKQVNKLVDVLKVRELTERPHIEREIVLVKIFAENNEQREEVKRSADIFRGQIVDVTARVYTVQLLGTSEKVEAFIDVMRENATILETVRSGTVGIGRGEKSLTP
ncbi:MAG: acetolactate synthase small subunit [Gammaproteobacteria bacterium]|nr:acetolactate synthase small subunit [Gammaproteobacteria bacterium]